MKQLKFASHLVPLILSGEKTSTFRLFDEKNLSVGDALELIDKDTGRVFARAKIVSVYEKPLGELTKEDYGGHEPYRIPEETLQTFRGYYGDHVTNKSIVKIIKFELIK